MRKLLVRGARLHSVRATRPQCGVELGFLIERARHTSGVGFEGDVESITSPLIRVAMKASGQRVLLFSLDVHSDELGPVVVAAGLPKQPISQQAHTP
jgi:hypothetical protein